jgi:hypothetical protein
MYGFDGDDQNQWQLNNYVKQCRSMNAAKTNSEMRNECFGIICHFCKDGDSDDNISHDF